ncbi:hypothetical protein J6590_055851 [Homalodisca vitripennis]|nr:hypothetical protein J6590_055851 [Homalodisca vitripennis]
MADQFRNRECLESPRPVCSGYIWHEPQGKSPVPRELFGVPVHTRVIYSITRMFTAQSLFEMTPTILVASCAPLTRHVLGPIYASIQHWWRLALYISCNLPLAFLDLYKGCDFTAKLEYVAY